VFISIISAIQRTKRAIAMDVVNVLNVLLAGRLPVGRRMSRAILIFLNNGESGVLPT